MLSSACLLVNTLRSSSLRLLIEFILRAAIFSSYCALLILPLAYFSSSALSSSSIDFSRNVFLYSSNALMACSLSLSMPSSFNASTLSWYSFSNANSSARSAFSISRIALRLSSAACLLASAACFAASARSLAASLAACACSASMTIRSSLLFFRSALFFQFSLRSSLNCFVNCLYLSLSTSPICFNICSSLYIFCMRSLVLSRIAFVVFINATIFLRSRSSVLLPLACASLISKSNAACCLDCLALMELASFLSSLSRSFVLFSALALVFLVCSSSMIPNASITFITLNIINRIGPNAIMTEPATIFIIGPNLLKPSYTLNNAALTLSQLAANNPTPTNMAPIPVAISATLSAFVANVAVVVAAALVVLAAASPVVAAACPPLVPVSATPTAICSPVANTSPSLAAVNAPVAAVAPTSAAVLAPVAAVSAPSAAVSSPSATTNASVAANWPVNTKLRILSAAFANVVTINP